MTEEVVVQIKIQGGGLDLWRKKEAGCRLFAKVYWELCPMHLNPLFLADGDRERGRRPWRGEPRHDRTQGYGAHQELAPRGSSGNISFEFYCYLYFIFDRL